MRVLVMNDHPFIRRGIVSLLEREEVCDWIVEATSFKIGLDVIRKENMDIAIVDMTLGKSCTLDFIRDVRKIQSDCKFIVFTSSLEYHDFHEAKALQVDGYILKDVLPEEFVHALRIVQKGRRYYDPDVLDLQQTSDLNHQSVEQLTPKEREVLVELGKGKTNREIAHDLFISEFTVKKHVGQILAKLELPDRTQAALYANALGIVTYAVQ